MAVHFLFLLKIRESSLEILTVNNTMGGEHLGICTTQTDLARPE